TEIVEVARRIGHTIDLKPGPEWRQDLASRSVEHYEVLAAVLAPDPPRDPAGVTTPAPDRDGPHGGFTPIVANGITEKVLRRYLRTMTPLRRNA
ncbi:MAG TPA: hypothetical protein VET24_10650, partial [Actinomycetota bacterium]|nr:hypothetical protein [Actinomycetota bacterium]